MDEIITGGTGYKDYSSLPPEVEVTPPDYSIYPSYKRAIGFLTRGCIRERPWCVVSRKEGNIRPAATWEQIRRPDSREIVFLDNNVLRTLCDLLYGRPHFFSRSLYPNAKIYAKIPR